jgi:hypothetical protein
MPMPQFNGHVERLTIPEMLSKWGPESTELVVSKVVETGNFEFAVIDGSRVQDYQLIIEAEVDECPVIYL